jgi:hypothetical protein
MDRREEILKWFEDGEISETQKDDLLYMLEEGE